MQADFALLFVFHFLLSAGAKWVVPILICLWKHQPGFLVMTDSNETFKI